MVAEAVEEIEKWEKAHKNTCYTLYLPLQKSKESRKQFGWQFDNLVDSDQRNEHFHENCNMGKFRKK